MGPLSILKGFGLHICSNLAVKLALLLVDNRHRFLVKLLNDILNASAVADSQPCCALDIPALRASDQFDDRFWNAL